jgi:hypothetical protein
MSEGNRLHNWGGKLKSKDPLTLEDRARLGDILIETVSRHMTRNHRENRAHPEGAYPFRRREDRMRDSAELKGLMGIVEKFNEGLK